jgi:hypothetical protein
VRLGLAVLDVEGLDAVHAALREAPQRRLDLGARVDVPERVRPHGDAPGVVDRRNRVGDRRDRARTVGRRAGDEVRDE